MGDAAPSRPSLGRHRYSWEDDEENDQPQAQVQAAKSGIYEEPETITPAAPVQASTPIREDTSLARDNEYPAAPQYRPDAQTQSPASYRVPDINFGEGDRSDSSNRRSGSLNDSRAMPATHDEPRLPEIRADDLDEDDLSNVAPDPSSPALAPGFGRSFDTSTQAPLPEIPADSPKSYSGPPPKLTAFRDITAMSSYGERLATFNSTRHEFARLDNGLGDWLSYMVTTHPEHAEAVAPNVKPMVETGFASSMRHKLAPAIPKVTRSGTSGASQPYYQQYLDSAGDLPSTSTSQLSSSPSQRDPSQSRSTSGQHKGKDFLGSFSGKATTGAKGLFAKGKSRFGKTGNEKVVD